MIKDWQNIGSMDSRSFICGHCGNPLASNMGWFAHRHGDGGMAAHIYICHHCKKPTFFDEDNKQTPGSIYGESVRDITDESVKVLYEEARKCMSTDSFTAAVLCCRKLLMNIAVSKGATPGQQFIEYVEYLSSKGHVPTGSKEWVDHIRTKGNEANHEIVTMKQEDAEDLLTFIGMLLKLIYEYPSKIKKKTAPKP